MSYEGYEQHICKNGHYFETNCLYAFDIEETQCPSCKEPTAWYNGVDETNCESYGLIPLTLLKEKFLFSGEVKEVCNLGHVHTTKEAVFRIPTREETKPLRHCRVDGELKRIDEFL